MEKQQKESRGFQSTIHEGFRQGNVSTTKSSPNARSSSKISSKGEIGSSSKLLVNSFGWNSRRCFKCHGYGHIASECPNRKVITLVEEKSDDEENEDAHTDLEILEEEEEVIYVNQGEYLVI